jgi:hypothetical protein
MQAALVLGTTLIGWALRGGVSWPAWSPQAEDFNLINNLTFIVQMGGGVPAFASLAGHELVWPVLGGIPEAPYYELGGYYLIVAGAINYFCALNLYDRLVRRDRRYEQQEAEGAGL